ncbi:MAG: hypothetical protein LUI14_11625 [Lachnospiraceae bacterium]|nr:hypothetical protein [Lachnospiraceae bacterium]MCD7766957.1 hypothetical protein [Lachnospiraceae bacterium]
MKRCIVCGNIGSDGDTVCSVCGNPFVEMEDAPVEEAPEDSLEEMEEQLKEMWAKVQGEGSSSVQKGTAEPELTVITEEAPVSGAEEAPEAAARDSVDVETLMKAAAEKTAEADRLPEEAEPSENPQEAEPSEKPEEAESSEKPEEAGASEKPQEAQTAGMAQEAELSQKPQGSEPVGTAQEAKEEEIQTAKRAAAHRKKGGPQIYGQESMAEYSGAQGVIRRDVQGGHTTAERGTGAGTASGRSASRPPRRPASTPMKETVPVQSAEASSQGNTPANVQSNLKNGTKPAAQPQRMGVPPYPQPAQAGQGNGQHGGKHSGTARRIMEAAQDAIASPLLILITLLQTAYFVSSVAAIFLRQLNYEQAVKLLALLPLPSQISGYTSLLQAAMAQLDSGALILNLVIRIPDLLFCIALWALCITVRSAGDKMSGAGFLFMKIAVILNMIAACAVLLVVLVVFVTFVIAAWNTGTTSLITLAVVLLVLAIIVTMAVLMYFFCYLSTIKTVRKNAVNGERYGSVSVYVAVVKMIVALTAIISLLSGIVNSEITGIITGVGQLGFMILFGIWILKYRSTLSEYAD